MLEDFNDKLRRNLVVFCGAYLALAYLDVSWTKLLNAQFSNMPGFELNPVKLTWLSLAFFSYLVFRWITSDDFLEEEKETKKRWLDDVQAETEIVIRKVFSRAPVKAPSWITLDDKASQAAIDSWFKIWPEAIKSGVTYNSLVQPQNRLIYSGTISYGLYWLDERGSVWGTSIRGEARVELPLWLRNRVRFGAALRTILDQYFWGWQFPILLAFFTAVLLVNRAIYS